MHDTVAVFYTCLKGARFVRLETGVFFPVMPPVRPISCCAHFQYPYFPLFMCFRAILLCAQAPKLAVYGHAVYRYVGTDTRVQARLLSEFGSLRSAGAPNFRKRATNHSLLFVYQDAQPRLYFMALNRRHLQHATAAKTYSTRCGMQILTTLYLRCQSPDLRRPYSDWHPSVRSSRKYTVQPAEYGDDPHRCSYTPAPLPPLLNFPTPLWRATVKPLQLCAAYIHCIFFPVGNSINSHTLHEHHSPPSHSMTSIIRRFPRDRNVGGADRAR